MLEENLEEKLMRARGGDRAAREELLQDCRSFIGKVAAACCGRALAWGRDDELSIAIIAFNEAIDRYEEGRQVPFLAFARLVVKSRLTDYLRSEARRSMSILHLAARDNGEAAEEMALTAVSRESFLEETAAREREEELNEYKTLLAEFGTTLDDLVRCSPKHRDSRLTLIRAARELAGRQDLLEVMLKHKRLPVKELSAVTGVHRKVLERGRKYVMAVALILHRRDDFVYLYSYLKPGAGNQRGRDR